MNVSFDIKFECIDATEAKGTFAGRQLREGEFDAVIIMAGQRAFGARNQGR